MEPGLNLGSVALDFTLRTVLPDCLQIQVALPQLSPQGLMALMTVSSHHDHSTNDPPLLHRGYTSCWVWPICAGDPSAVSLPAPSLFSQNQCPTGLQLLPPQGSRSKNPPFSFIFDLVSSASSPSSCKHVPVHHLQNENPLWSSSTSNLILATTSPCDLDKVLTFSKRLSFLHLNNKSTGPEGL